MYAPAVARVRVYIAQSLDGFIAGEDDDISWLPAPEDPTEDFGFGAFLSEIGCLLMGRRTYDVVAGFGPEVWAYGDTPVHVWTRRPLTADRPTVQAVGGRIEAAVADARAAAGDRDVYLDGGALIRAALDAGLVDELTVTTVPVVLGRGRPLFAGVAQRQALTLAEAAPIGLGMVKATYTVAST